MFVLKMYKELFFLPGQIEALTKIFVPRRDTIIIYPQNRSLAH